MFTDSCDVLTKCLRRAFRVNTSVLIFSCRANESNTVSQDATDFLRVLQMELSKLALMAILSRSIPKRSKAFQQLVDERVEAGKCLNKFIVTGDVTIDCDGKAGGLGLCDKCRAAYYREKGRGSEEERITYEAESIAAGLVLSAGELQRRKRKSLIARRRNVG